MVCELLWSDHLFSYWDLTFTWSLQFPLGINAAASVCIGNELGAGNTAKAKLICKVVLVLAGTGGAPVKEIYIVPSVRERLTCFSRLNGRNPRCDSGHRHLQQQIGLRLHIYLWWVSLNNNTHWSLDPSGNHGMTIFLHCLQKHCGDRLRKPHGLLICAVLWRVAGMLENAETLDSLSPSSLSLTVCVCAFPVHMHGDFHWLWDAGRCRPIQPGFLLRYWSAGGNSSDVCC